MCTQICRVSIQSVSFLSLFIAGIASAQPNNAAEYASASLAYVPRDSVLLLNIRPSRLSKAEALLPFSNAVKESERTGFFKYLPGPDELDTFQVVLMLGREQPQSVSTFSFKTKEGLNKYIDTLGAIDKSVEYVGERYLEYARGHIIFQRDARTIMVAHDESSIRRCLLAGKEGATTTNWVQQWKLVADKDASIVVNTSLLRSVGIDRLMDLVNEMQGSQHAGQLVYRLAPIWQQSSHVTGYVNVTDHIEIHATSSSVNEDEAKLVHASLVTAVSLIRSTLSTVTADMADPSSDVPPELLQSLSLFDQVLEKAEVKRDLHKVQLRLSTTPQSTRRVASMLAPLASAAQSRAGQSRSLNNLRQLAIAVHNYHDVYNAFPAAVQLGPKETPRSWRVTILPFMEQSKLYDEYRQDEPWDSPHNIKLVDRMPDVFRSPLDVPDSKNTSYFAIVGPGTIYEEGRKARFANITDGMTYTILFVESKKAVPWTKPEDISYDERTPVPKFGGWYRARFFVAMCDGSIRSFPHDWDERMLRNAITPNDGEPVDLPGDD